jgi:hypothetical protein
MSTLKKILLILWDSSRFQTLSTLFFNEMHVPRAIHFSLVAIIFKKCMYLSKLASQLVTSTPWEMFLWADDGVHQSKFWFWHFKVPNFIHPVEFFKRVPAIKNIEKKIFFVKTLSKLGALTVCPWLLFLFSDVKMSFFIWFTVRVADICPWLRCRGRIQRRPTWQRFGSFFRWRNVFLFFHV